jgi:hypothetical protein
VHIGDEEEVVGGGNEKVKSGTAEHLENA